MSLPIGAVLASSSSSSSSGTSSSGGSSSIFDSLSRLLSGGSAGGSFSPGLTTDQQVARLSSQLESLRGALHELGRRPSASTVVVHGSGGSGSSSPWLSGLTLFGVLSLSASGLYFFYRFPVQFTALTDAVLPVSKQALKEGLTICTDAIGTVMEQLKRVSRNLSSQIASVDEKVEKNVSICLSLGTELSEVHAKIDSIEAALATADAKATYTQKGVHLLCSVVSETVCNSQGGRTAQRLQDFASGSLPPSGLDHHQGMGAGGTALDHLRAMSAEKAGPGGYRIAQSQQPDPCDLEVEMTLSTSTPKKRTVNERLTDIQRMAEGLQYSLPRTPSPRRDAEYATTPSGAATASPALLRTR